MPEENYENQYFTDINVRTKDLEEKQRILKDRTLLIGKNLIEFKEETIQDIIELKKEIEVLKQTVQRLKSFLETASNEFSKFARKEDVEILVKQAKMFQPLELVTKQDLEKLKKS